jgi:type VI secretion system secreted protein Hcp
MSNIFVKIDSIKGQSTAVGFDKQIECDTFSHGVTTGTTTDVSNGHRTKGRPNIHDITLSKSLDIASAPLYDACLSGKDLKMVTITNTRIDEHKMMAGWVITLDNALVSSIQTAGGGNGIPSESFSLNFTKMKIVFKQQDAKGAIKGSNGAEWDLTKITGKGK